MNNKLIINTNLLRKESEFKTYTCVVEKAVPVPTEEFERLKHTPMCNNDLISENLNSMWYGNGVHHCLLIYDKQQGDGLLIESEGAPYARYAQYIPNAKLLYENHMQTHLQELKFCCPLEINREPECWYDEEYEKISSYEASVYESEINRFIEDFTMPGELVGVITAQIYGQLTDEELEEFRSYCEGQLSDGVGESLEQRPIKTPDGDIYVSFWNSDDNWSLQTEEEINSIQSEDLTDEPDIGMTM